MSAAKSRKRRNDDVSWQWWLTFIGQPMAHNYYLYYLVDRVFEEHPGIAGVVEIGTGHGALTTVLGLWGIKRDVPILTIDHRNTHDDRIFDALGIRYLEADEYGEETAGAVREIFGRGPVFFICDGGDKPREFRFWAPRVPSGSVIAAHDWGVEIGPDDVTDVVRDNGLDPFLPDQWTRLNVQFAMWRRP
jgi:hypothetical protein